MKLKTVHLEVTVRKGEMNGTNLAQYFSNFSIRKDFDKNMAPSNIDV